MDHAIFSTPHAVEPTLEERETPIEYRSLDAELPERMDMWRVQTEGYTEGTGQLIGIVSNPRGFLDSPDTEWISGGTNTKGERSVALGRHGNFFHWGFAASPSFLTEEAKLVFINAVHYIHRFDGQAPIVRRWKGTPTRDYVDYAMEPLTEAGYARAMASHLEWVAGFEQQQAEVRARIEAGEEVSDFDRGLLDMRLPQAPDRFERVRSLISEAVWSELGEDAAALHAYMSANRAYYAPTGGWYEMAVDEELRAFGLPSDDPAFLESAIAALSDPDPERSARAQGLLERYTTQDLQGAQAWSSWHANNAHRLFFTQAGGFLWMENTLEPSRLEAAADDLDPDPSHPLDASLALEGIGPGRYRATVLVAVHEDWHTYDRVSPGAPYAPLRLELDLPEGVSQVGEWERPRSFPDRANPRQSVFVGELAFTCELSCAEGSIVEDLLCNLSFQVCDARLCLPPQNLELEVDLSL